MGKKGRILFTSVKKRMIKSRPSNCPGKYSGVERDGEGNVLREFNCINTCKFKRRN